jgi:hypothetical protein
MVRALRLLRISGSILMNSAVRAQDADQRVSNDGGDDPDHLEAVGEESVSRTKYALSWIASLLP